MNSLPENTCRRFLLGIASEEEESLMENAVLAGQLDDAFLLDAEDGLMDDYLLRDMTHEERHGFITHFLSTEERRQRLAFGAALIEYARKQPADAPSVGRKPASQGTIRLLSWKRTALLAAAASLLLAAFAGFQQVMLRRQGQIASEARNEVIRLQAALGSANSAATAQTAPSLQVGMDQMPAIEFASATRGVFSPPFRVPAHAQFVRIDVKLPTPFAMKYREVLVASNGDKLWTEEFPVSIVPGTKESTMILPASILRPGSYHLRLEQASIDDHFVESGDWVFHVPNE